MIESRVAKKYATALFALARSRGIEVGMREDLVALRHGLEKDRRLLDLLASPQISDEEKHAVARRVLAGSSQSVVVDFVLLLVDKARTEHLLRTIELFERLHDEAMGVVDATITSAVPLADGEVRDVVARLERVSGRTVHHHVEVDPAILGGVVVMIGGEIIDHSVRFDLSRLRDALRAVKVHQAA